MKRIAIILVLAGCACTSGCGTMLSIVADEAPYGESMIYSGVQLDYWAAFDPDSSHFRSAGKVLAVVDMPLSTVADTVCLPYTIPRSMFGNRERETSSNKAVQATSLRDAPDL